MTTLQRVRESNQIDNEELHEITKIMFDSFIINGEYKSQSYISKKEQLIDSFSTFIQQYLKFNFLAIRFL